MTSSVLSTLARFATLVREVAPMPVDIDAVTLESHLADDFSLDSITLVALVALTEELFGIALSNHPEDVAAIQTVGDAVRLIDRLTAMG